MHQFCHRAGYAHRCLFESLDCRVHLSGGPSVSGWSFDPTVAAAITVAFAAAIDPSTLAAGDLQILNRSSGETFAALDATTRDADTAAVFALPPGLPRGGYRFALPAGSVADAAGNPLSSDAVLQGSGVFILPGDANRDRAVDVADLGVLASHWQQTGRTFAQGDFDYDGAVDVADLGVLSSNWQAAIGGASISGGDWPSDGAATAQSTGLSLLSGAWAHVASTDLPPSSASTGHIALPEGVGGALRIDPVDGTGQPFAGAYVDHTINVWLRAQRGAACPPDGVSGTLLNIDSGGTDYRLSGFVRNNGDCDGILLLSNSFFGGTSDRVATASGAPATVLFDRWFRLSLHILRHPTAGRIELFVNGAMIAVHTGDTESTMALPDLRAGLRLGLPAWAGVSWQVAPAIESFAGEDFTIRPDFALNQAEPDAAVAQAHPMRFFGRLNGGFWRRESGDAGVAVLPYSTGGTNPFRSRAVLTGPPGASAALRTIDALGAPPSRWDGWSTIVFPMLYVPTGGRLDVRLDAAAGGGSVAHLTIRDGAMHAPAGLAAPWDHADRYALAIHLHESGQSTFTLLNLSDDFTQQTGWGGALAPGVEGGPRPILDLGPARFDATLGVGGVELDGVWVFREWSIAGLDSMTTAPAFGVAPAYQVSVNNVSGHFPAGRDSELVPGGAYPLAGAGLPRVAFNVTMGRAGRRRRDWITSIGQHVHATLRATRLYNIDGGSVNDINGIDDANPISSPVLQQLQVDLAQTIQWLTANGNGVVVSTMMRRELAMTPSENLGIDLFNDFARGIVPALQVGGLVQFTDPAAAYPDHRVLFRPNDVHFLDALEPRYAAIFAAGIGAPSVARLVLSGLAR